MSALIVVGGGVAVANAATSAKQQAPGGYGASGAPGGGRGVPGGGGPGGGPGGGAPGGALRGGAELARALHGEYVVKDSAGKYVTQRLQSGTVTAVSATSITAKSEDGHETTFTVDAATKVNGGSSKIADVKTGDAVTVVGTASGAATTATTITDAKLRTGAGQPGARPSGSARPPR